MSTKTDILQASPPVTVTGLTLYGYPLQEFILWGTLFYTLIMILLKLPEVWHMLVRGYKAIKG